jgi:hypothetical protein
MKNIRFRRGLSRLLVSLAYISCLFEWLWAFVIGLPLLLKSGVLDMLSSPTPPEPVPMPTPEPSPLVWAFIVVVIVGLFVMTIMALLRLPKTISQAGQKIVTHTAEAIIPIVTHHQTVPAKKRFVLTRRITLLIQLSISFLPLLPCWLLPPPDGLTKDIMLITTLTLSGLSGLSFWLAWLIAPPKKSTSRTRSHAFRG